MEKIGEFGINIQLFKENQNLIPVFRGIDINMPKEVIISQLKSFLKDIEDKYNANFKPDVTTFNGKPKDGE